MENPDVNNSVQVVQQFIWPGVICRDARKVL